MRTIDVDDELELDASVALDAALTREELTEDDDRDEPPPLRSKAYNAAHRQLPATKARLTPSPSPWERPREGFTAAMEARVPEMRNTKEASLVKGLSHSLDVPARRKC